MSEDKDINMTEAKRKSFLEGHKLFHDTFKHLTTLSTGSILILATLLEKLFKFPTWKILIPIAFAGFIVSVIGSVLTMIMLAYALQAHGEPSDTETNVGASGMFTALLGFFIGILSLIIFTVKNFY